ncbi:MAG TPA: ABC transporter permease, partial [Thermoanaerobaculia bacterium]|nr:ABC transporter permease [Thermoanaerobaculia bacterium]
LAPALSATRVRVGQVLRESGRGTVEGRHRGGKLLVVGQFALSLLLLVAAGLFVRTLRNLEQVELGYPADRLLIVALDPQAAGLESQDAQPFLDDLFERLGSLPGAAGATASINGLFSGTESSTTVEFEGYKPAQEKETEVLYDEVGPKYFQTVGLPLLAGRDITAADRRPAGRVAVINQALARTYFPGANPVGQHLTVTGAHPITYEIVGVAADARDHKLRGPVEPRFYYPMLADEGFPGALYFEVASAHPAALVQPVRQALKDYRATVPVDSVTTLEENLAEEVNEERMIARLSAAFGVLALVLAIGLAPVLLHAGPAADLLPRRHLGAPAACGSRRSSCSPRCRSER